MAAVTGFSSVKRETTPILQGDDAERKAYRQIFNADSICDGRLDAIVQTAEPMDVVVSAIYGDTASYIDAYRVDIEDHLDRSVELFFLTSICCYKTPFHFEWVSANDQYGKGRMATLKTCDKEKVAFNTQAAHSSVLPCLMAYPRAEWEAYKENGGEKPEGFIWLKHSPYYTKNNGTIELERTINQADCRRDGTHLDKMLRERAIRIVNNVAQGKYGPREATRKFQEVYIRSLEKAIAKLEDDDLRVSVLEIYLERLLDIDLVDDLSFDQMVGVRIEHLEEDRLRSIVYERRFDFIRGCQSIESQIARDILDGQNEMLKKNRKSLPRVDYRIRYILLEEMDDTMRTRLEKLFCTSLAQLQAGFDLNESRLRSYEGTARITSFREKHGEAIDALAEKLRRQFETIERTELVFRAKLFKDLRTKFLSVTQAIFAKRFKKNFPGEPMSQPMVSRIEHAARGATGKTYATPLNQRRKWLSIEKSLKIAQAFGVDPGHFLPGTIASSY
ncbi:MAG: hypothetical protein KR126chlam1_01478 [Chlamydiae bacterium]|nr:hypothetical protein [Chlamydiota bacterium]